MNNIILITGATSGFGKATAEKFAANGWYLIITGRRKDRLDQIQESLQKQYGIKVLALELDVRNKEKVFGILGNLPEEWRGVDVLVNNAGLALGRDPFEAADMDDWETMIDTNVKGLLYVSRAVVPYMTERKKGHIINIGSIAGKEVYKDGNVYCATKYAVGALSKAQRIDLLQYGIKVTNVCPGAAETEFSDVRFKGDATKAKATYAGYTPLSATDIADTIYYCATLPHHVCINDLEITCLAQASAVNFHKA